MGVTPGKKTPKTTPKQKSTADSEPMETTITSPEKKTGTPATEKAITPKPPSNGSEKKSDSKKKKTLKRKLDDDDYEEMKNSEAVVSEEDLNDSQKESSKKQKKKKQKVDSETENLSPDSAKKTNLSSGDDKEDEEGKNLPSECKLFVTSIGLEDMSKQELKDFFKGHGYSLVLNVKRIKSRHAFVGFATEKEAKKVRASLDKSDCRGFPLSIDSKDLMFASLGLAKTKPTKLINKEGTADCILYVSPMTPNLTKQDLKDSLVGVVRVLRKSGKKNWVRVECINSTVAKELHRSHQGKVVEGTALRLETAEEFQKRITVEETEKARKVQKQRQLEKKMEKKQKQTKKQEKSKPEPKDSSDESDSEEDAGGVKVADDDDDSEEEVPPPRSKKTKVAGKR